MRICVHGLGSGRKPLGALETFGHIRMGSNRGGRVSVRLPGSDFRFFSPRFGMVQMVAKRCRILCKASSRKGSLGGVGIEVRWVG